MVVYLSLWNIPRKNPRRNSRTTAVNMVRDGQRLDVDAG
jgi:hypothetical protein